MASLDHSLLSTSFRTCPKKVRQVYVNVLNLETLNLQQLNANEKCSNRNMRAHKVPIFYITKFLHLNWVPNPQHIFIKKIQIQHISVYNKGGQEAGGGDSRVGVGRGAGGSLTQRRSRAITSNLAATQPALSTGSRRPMHA